MQCFVDSCARSMCHHPSTKDDAACPIESRIPLDRYSNAIELELAKQLAIDIFNNYYSPPDGDVPLPLHRLLTTEAFARYDGYREGAGGCDDGGGYAISGFVGASTFHSRRSHRRSNAVVVGDYDQRAQLAIAIDK